MVAGRHVRYPNQELRDRELDSRFSRREIAYSSDDYDQVRNCTRDNELRRIRDVRHGDRNKDKDKDRFKSRVRPMDIKEREMMDTGHLASRSNLGSSDDIADYRPNQFGVLVRFVNREPGELSNESRSNDVIESELQVKDNGDVKMVENGVQLFTNNVG